MRLGGVQGSQHVTMLLLGTHDTNLKSSIWTQLISDAAMGSSRLPLLRVLLSVHCLPSCSTSDASPSTATLKPRQ